MNHVMLDIETLGSNPRAAVIEIGAIRFDPFTNELGGEFLVKIEFGEAARYGEMDGDTVEWWMKQEPDAQDVLMRGRRVKSLSAIRLFSSYLNGNTGEWGARADDAIVWGKGPTFDCAIIRHLFKQFYPGDPWKFYNERCVRTALDMGFVDDDSIKFVGTRHNGLDDARHQARQVQLAYENLGIRE